VDDIPDDIPNYKYSTAITDKYVPVGATSLRVQDPNNFAIGDSVAIVRRVSTEWVAVMVGRLQSPRGCLHSAQGMDKLVRDGVKQTWLPINSTLNQYRVISDIQKSTIFFDVPTTDAVNAVRRSLNSRDML
jgi:hypothetical protein